MTDKPLIFFTPETYFELVSKMEEEGLSKEEIAARLEDIKAKIVLTEEEIPTKVHEYEGFPTLH